MGQRLREAMLKLKMLQMAKEEMEEKLQDDVRNISAKREDEKDEVQLIQVL